MIWIRADANREIGVGHVMRCLTIADALKKQGQQVKFIVSDTSVIGLLESRGQEYRVLGSDYRDMESELSALQEFIALDKPKVMLADSYSVTSEYMSRVPRDVRVAYMDDMCRTDILPDLLINYNIFAEEALYGERTSKVRFLLGVPYVPVRQEFRNVNYQPCETAERVIITTGGSDKYNLAGQILRGVLKNETTALLKYTVVSGMYNTHLEDLKQLAKEHENIELRCNVSNMWDLMRESDIAVSAAGSTMYELAALGLPTVCFSFVDNQERIARGFYEKGLVPYSGNYLLQGEKMILEIVEQIDCLAQDAELRRSYNRKQRETVDGLGAERIAAELIKLM